MRLGIIPLMVGASMASAGDANALPPVFSRDGRRLKDILDKAENGTLDITERDFIPEGAYIPDKAFKVLQKEDPSFSTPYLGLSEQDIFHIWHSHGNHLTPEQIENGIHALSYGDTRFITKNNPPQENGLGVVTPEGKGFNAALKPGDEFTHFYQMNPVKGKRLLAKAKSPVGSPGGSAFHPVSYSTEKYGPISQRASFSADGDSVRKQIPTKTGKIKNSGAVVIPAASMASIPESGLLRQFLLGMRGVAEGMGSIADVARTPLNWVNGALGGAHDYFRNPGVIVADALGLPMPRNNAEKKLGNINRTVSGALAESATGGVLARYGSGLLSQFGRFLSDSPALNATAEGLLEYLAGGRR